MVFLGFSRETGDQRRAECDIRDLSSELRDQLADLFIVCSSAHPL